MWRTAYDEVSMLKSGYHEQAIRTDASGSEVPGFWLRRRLSFGYDTYGLRTQNNKGLHHF